MDNKRFILVYSAGVVYGQQRDVDAYEDVGALGDAASPAARRV